MIVVSGCPRSGTSLMMQILRSALGEGCIYGEQFPQERGEALHKRRFPHETDAQYAYRQYALSLEPKKDLVDSKDMNPDGFWECPFTVRGIKYSFETEKELSILLDKREEKVCKIVSSGLARSDPRFVDKVILMARHPREVAKSQERLKREMRLKFGDGKIRDLYEGQTVHSPEFFIKSTLDVLEWLSAHPDIPVLVVPHRELIQDPVTVVQKVISFVGRGDALVGAGEVKPRLHRSHPEDDKKSNYWHDAEYLFDALLNLDYAALRAFSSDPTRPTNRERRSWICARCEQPMIPAHCRRCVSQIEFRDSLKKHAETNGIPWRERPCAWEVAYRDGPLESLEDSSHYNFWVDTTANTGS